MSTRPTYEELEQRVKELEEQNRELKRLKSEAKKQDEYKKSINSTDVSRRKQAEEALRESEERFRVLSEASFEGVLIHENGTIMDVNKTYTELSGYEYDEMIGMNVLELTPPECRDLMKQNIESDFEGAYESMG
ncbi:MAG: PAS domain S-box protein, partial [Desulfosalsimonas sp.]